MPKNNYFFFDLDGTLRRTKSGKPFINSPEDQEPIPGAVEAVQYYASQGFTLVGITDQDGVGGGFKTLKDCVDEQRITLELFPELSAIYFCPDDGEECWRVDATTEQKYIRSQILDPHRVGAKPLYDSFRKPGSGMIDLAFDHLFRQTNQYPDDCWMAGDRFEDQDAAGKAGFKFIWEYLMLAKFNPNPIDLNGIDEEVYAKFLNL